MNGPTYRTLGEFVIWLESELVKAQNSIHIFDIPRQRALEASIKHVREFKADCKLKDKALAEARKRSLDNCGDASL